jgi:hypothetical protein
MSLRVLALFAVAILSSGCVPVAEPLGDIDKAEPVKELIGEWQPENEKGVWIVERPEVKGHPKGLMRLVSVEQGKKREDVSKDNILWFFVTAVGKHQYAHILLVQGDKYPDFAHADKEGEYATWAKNDKRGYGIVRIQIDGDKATIYETELEAFGALMEAEKFTKTGGIYQTSAGWLAKYLEKNGPDAIFKKSTKLTRVKK